MNPSLVGGGAARLRACVDGILRNYQDERLAAAVRAEVDYLIACSASDCATDEMREYIHAALDPCNNAMVDSRIAAPIIRAMVDVIAG